MQRNRKDYVGLGEQFTTDTIEPAPEGRHEIQSVRMLERQNRSAALFVVAHYGASLVESGRLCVARRATDRTAWIEIKRQAATVAYRPVDEPDLLPTIAAQCTRVGYWRSARDAKRWEKKVQNPAPRPPQHVFPRYAHLSYPAAMTDGPPKIFDRTARALRRLRALRIPGERFLVVQAAEGLSARLEAVRRTFISAIDVDGSDTSFAIVRPHAANWSRVPLHADESFVGEEGQFDLVTSVLSLHAANDLPGVLVQIARVLKPDGLFVAALFGGETLFELRESLAAAEIETLGGISPRIAPLADVRDLGGLLQRAGFALPVADVERTVVRYRDLRTLFADLRAMGETNVLVERDRKPLPRQTLAAALAHYASKYADPDGRLRATFDVAYLTGWSPHESQQKPLRPGSSTARLADALGTSEKSAGEKVPKR